MKSPQTIPPPAQPPTAGQPPAVDVQGLERSFRGTVALAGVDLSVPQGSIFGLVGLNGAGKTTLIRHLIGSLKAHQGKVRVLGHDPVADPEGVLKRIGYLTEEDSLPKWMRVGELIDFTRALYPTWDNAYATELCDLFSLARSTKLRSLSKGQRARAGLLVAIAHRPELLILDEPSSGLDPIARRDILEAIIRTVSDDGRTVLFSSHLLDEVDRVCDHIAVMHDGRIIETTTTESIATDYAEIICRPKSAWSSPPSIQGVWGWQSSGQEWSAAAQRDRLESPEISSEIGLIQTRPMSLERWFAARVGRGGDGTSHPSPSAPNSVAKDSEAPNHV
ncbi:Daunorubicin/doxorubicin resistance ATP-binding protein DrrA [Rubripirellula lacrimiformis]|uniref:Daunorubicin/doxorubicin resistance ATP-binding protein DrrA n=1 Tax=Rubripirellula lacrimiformis TaxID=1930273 RepID=A0A517N7L4_9BACT|nr:ABC transporter ATP-binding protein [Rubripirellula lacrimiformis]QDT03133.1 Daunorubicin/doxorubicin resistance ATP-binding protein DrrA [Rubripirellula lacrimiformis]